MENAQEEVSVEKARLEELQAEYEKMLTKECMAETDSIRKLKDISHMNGELTVIIEQERMAYEASKQVYEMEIKDLKKNDQIIE